jgi:hypothetical protein
MECSFAGDKSIIRQALDLGKQVAAGKIRLPVFPGQEAVNGFQTL